MNFSPNKVCAPKRGYIFCPRGPPKYLLNFYRGGVSPPPYVGVPGPPPDFSTPGGYSPHRGPPLRFHLSQNWIDEKGTWASSRIIECLPKPRGFPKKVAPKEEECQLPKGLPLRTWIKDYSQTD